MIDSPSRHQQVQDDFLSGGGRMGTLIRDFDWSATPLGAPSDWPQSLRTVVRLMLTTNHPMFVFWGADSICLYNDAYSGSIGPEKHPKMLGAKGREMWDEIWHIIGPQIELVLAGDGATWHEDHLVPIIRHGRLEQVYWTYGYSPIDDELAPNGVGGVLVICTETTEKVLTARRLQLQVELADKLRNLTDPTAIMAIAAELLGTHLQVGCVGYGEVDPENRQITIGMDWTDGSFKSVAGSHSLNDYGAEMVSMTELGRTVRVNDVTLDPLTKGLNENASYDAIGTRALINAPLLKDGRWTSVLFVLSATPRVWTDNEAALIEEVAERTRSAVDRARAEEALRRTEEQVRELNTFLESTVKERTAELIAANEQLQGFAYSVAHDFRQEIRGISVNAALLLTDAGDTLDEANRDHLERLVHSARQLGTFVDDLLSYARLGKRRPSVERVDISSVAERIQKQRRDGGSSLPLPAFEIESGLAAYGDATMLATVLENLIDNACKYSSKVASPRVHVGSDGDGIFVEDNGIGFSMEFAEKVFEPFERLHPRDGYPGTGIGLANVKRIVEKHGGRVWAVSEPGAGSRFYVWLPSEPVTLKTI